jgi:hypothetical protein
LPNPKHDQPTLLKFKKKRWIPCKSIWEAELSLWKGWHYLNISQWLMKRFSECGLANQGELMILGHCECNTLYLWHNIKIRKFREAKLFQGFKNQCCVKRMYLSKCLPVTKEVGQSKLTICSKQIKKVTSKSGCRDPANKGLSQGFLLNPSSTLGYSWWAQISPKSSHDDNFIANETIHNFPCCVFSKAFKSPDNWQEFVREILDLVQSWLVLSIKFGLIAVWFIGPFYVLYGCTWSKSMIRFVTSFQSLRISRLLPLLHCKKNLCSAEVENMWV